MNWNKALTILAILFVPALSGCASSHIDPESMVPAVGEAAAAAETIQAYHTEFAVKTQNAGPQLSESTPVPSKEPLSATATATILLPSSTPLVSMAFTPSGTTTLTSSAAAPAVCNLAEFVTDISIPDGTIIPGNSLFTKTWRLKNTGSCEWTTDYDLVFLNGNSMNGPAAVGLPADIGPGETIDLSLNLIAPKEAGTYKGNWKLRSGRGEIFGIGPDAASPLYVQVMVSEAGTDALVPMDFAAFYCSASWSSSKEDNIPCPADEDFSNGSIQRDSTPRIEKDSEDDETALVMVPANDPGGTIRGHYPAFTIAREDRFTALTGCMAASPVCSVTFEILYSANGGPTQTMKSWNEAFDGSYTKIDIDLSALSGQSVVFILQVSNSDGSSKDDRAFWMAPKVIRK